MHEKHALATWKLGNITALASRQRKTKKTCVECPVLGLPGCLLTSIRQSDKHIT